jgi:replicative DNA helicase
VTDPVADLTSERAWLGCVFFDASTLAHAPIALSDFYSRAHSQIAAAMMAVHARREAVDMLSVRVELDRTGALRRAGGDEALLALTDLNPSVESALTLARRIRELAQLRAIGASSERLSAAVRERDVAAVRAIVAELTFERDAEDEILAFPELIARGVDAALTSREAKSDLRLGTASVDRDYRPGPGHIVVVAGRPNVGKTSLTFAWHVDSAQRGIASGIVSVDDDAAEYGARGMGAVLEVNPARLWNERIDPAEMQRMIAKVGAASKRLPIHFAQVRSKSIDAVEAVITRMVRVLGCRWVSVDFLTKIRAPGRDQRERTDEALARLGVLASTLEIPIIVLAQLRRLGEKQFREPHLDDLKESGRVEEDAQAAVLLWRDDDKPGTPIQAKLAKVKRTAAGRRFTLQRHPRTGLLIELDPNEGRYEPSRHRTDDDRSDFADD